MTRLEGGFVHLGHLVEQRQVHAVELLPRADLAPRHAGGALTRPQRQAARQTAVVVVVVKGGRLDPSVVSVARIVCVIFINLRHVIQPSHE